jgi:hypothetical protein
MNATMGQGRGVVQLLYQMKRWMYRTGRPGLLARAINRVSAVQFSAGLVPGGSGRVRGRAVPGIDAR